MTQFQRVPLSRVVSLVERLEAPLPGKIYRQIGVRLWGEGAYERQSLDGSETKYSFLSRVETDDVIVNKIWARNGSVAVVPPHLAGCYASGEFPLFRPDATALSPRWFQWLTKTADFWNQCDEQSRGTSGKNRIRPEQFLHVAIPLPPLVEQRRITARIEELAARSGEVRALRQQAVDEAEALVASHLNRVFGDYYRGVRGTLSAPRWDRLDALVDDVADGPHVTPTYVQEGVPFITVLNITSGRIRFGDNKFITPQDHALFQRRAKAEPGDVLLSKDGTIGIPCFVDTDREFGFFVSVALIKPTRTSLDGEFLAWAIRAPYLQTQILRRSRGDMIRHLVLREIRDLTVPVPSLPEQRRVVDELAMLQARVDTLKRLQSKSGAELDALLPSILDKAFKGEL
jgi:type I restriction enzyme S subunit